jgi:hypothetical protein
MGTISQIQEKFRQVSAGDRGGSTFDSGSGGGDDGGMEARISALEAANLETRDRLIKIETRMESLASKEDLHKELSAQTWRLVTFTCSFGTALVAATYFIAKHIS